MQLCHTIHTHGVPIYVTSNYRIFTIAFEALMRRNIRTKLEYEAPTVSKDYNRMEKEITFWDKQYIMKWDKQHRHPLCEQHQFKVANKNLLKKRKVNNWSTAHEIEIYGIIETYRFNNNGKL